MVYESLVYESLVYEWLTMAGQREYLMRDGHPRRSDVGGRIRLPGSEVDDPRIGRRSDEGEPHWEQGGQVDPGWDASSPVLVLGPLRQTGVGAEPTRDCK